MKVLTVLLTLSQVVCGGVNVFAANRTQSEFVLPVKLYGEHLVVVRGGIGELLEQNLVVDTGSYPSAIDADVARKLKLKVNQGEGRALGQNIPAGATIVSQVEIGPLQARGLPVVVEDLSKLSAQLGVRVDALIGLDVLARSSFRIDYVAKEMAFGAPEKFVFAAPLESRKAMGCVAMNVDGHVVHLLIDTGAAKTVLFTDRVPWLSHTQKPEQAYRTLAGVLRLSGAKANALQVGSASLAPDDVFISDARNMGIFPFDGVLATRGAHFNKIAFDFEHEVFSWEMDGVPGPPLHSPSSLSNLAQASANDAGTPSGGSGLDTEQDATVSSETH